MALVVNPQLQQLHALYAQAQAFAQNPPDNEQPLAQLNLQLTNAAFDFPEELGAIQGAIANLNEAFGRIGAAAPRPIRADVLIPPDAEHVEAEQVEQVFQQFMQIANQHFGNPQPAQNTPRPESRPAQSAPQPENRPAQSAPPATPVSNTAAHTPVSPVTSVSATPSQQPVASEPTTLSDRILTAFRSVIETFCSWFASFIAYCSSSFYGSSEQPSTQTVTLPEQSQTSPQALAPAPTHQEQPSSILPAQPQVSAQNQAEPAPQTPQQVVAATPANLVPGRFQSLGHLGREERLNQGHECANRMAAELWEHLYLEAANRDEDNFGLLIDRSLGVLIPQANENNIGDWNFPRYGIAPTQNYQNEVGLVSMSALQARQIKAAKIVKGNEVHLVMIDARNRNQLEFYYFNPYAEGGAYLQKFDRLVDLTDHLNQALPVEADHPFELVGIRRLQN